MASEVEALLAQAQASLDALEVEAALEMCTRACSLEPTNAVALAMLGEVNLQAGFTERAHAALQRSVELEPEGGGSRFMSLGQLSEGAAALKWFERGLTALRAERAEAEGRSGERSELQRQWLAATHALASGLCAAAEVYLTDACDEDGAEERCEALATEAVGLVSSLEEQAGLAEPYVTLASVRLSQQRPADAEPLLLSALEIFARPDEAAAGSQSGSGAGPNAGVDLRASVAKMLMEVGRAPEAHELMLALRLEDDESLELAYLCGCAAVQTGELESAVLELGGAIAFARSERCPEDERGWLPELEELLADAKAAAAAAAPAAAAKA